MKFESQQNTSEQFDLQFEVDDSRPNHTRYLFKNVAVIVDDSGKNIKEYPELMFGTFDGVPNRNILCQPEEPIEGVSMSYVAACIRKVSEVTGIQTFWFHPYGDDAYGEEKKEAREAARQRLFNRFGKLTPGPNGYGYVISV